METKKIKRILAFFLAVIFAFSTCMTASPYTVQATEEPKLSVKVTLGDGVSTEDLIFDGLNMEFTDRNGQEIGSTSIAKEDLGTTKTTEILYSKISEISNIIVTDTKQLYTVAASEADFDDETHTMVLEIQGFSVNTNKNSISGTDSVYAEDTNSFSVQGTWGPYIDEWVIEDNIAKAEFSDGKNTNTSCVIKATNGNETAFTLIAKAKGNEIARKQIHVIQKDTNLEVTCSNESQSWYGTSTEVTFKLTSNGQVVAGKQIQYQYIDGKNNQITGTCPELTNEEGVTTAEITLNGYQSTVEVTGSFAGDEVYKDCKNSDTYKPNKEEGTMEFDRENSPVEQLELTYGTDATELTIKLQHKTDNIEEPFSSININYTADSNISVTSNQEERTLTITPLKVSDEEIPVTIDAKTENYTFTKTIYVKVKPYPLAVKEGSVHVFTPGKANLENAVEDVKIYDGTSTVDVKATLVDAQVKGITPTTETKDEIKLFQEIVFGGYDSKLKDVRGEEEKQIMTFAPKNLSTVSNLREDLKTNYKIEEVEMEVPLTIQKRTLKLTINKASRGFRDLEYLDENEKPLTDLRDLIEIQPKDTANETGFVDEESHLTGFTLPNVLDTTVTEDQAKDIKHKDTVKYSNQDKALQFEKNDKNANPTNNYKFDLTATGTLEITGEKDAAGYVSVREDSFHVHEDKDNNTRYYGNDATVKFALEGDYNKIYLWDEKNKNGDDITEKGLELKIPEDNETSITKQFYMTHEEGGDTEPIAKTEKFTIEFVYDGTAPECDEIELGQQASVINDLKQAITFGIYNKEIIEATVKFSDNQSGVNGMSYFVAKTDKDQNYDELLENAKFTDTDPVEKSDEDGTYIWTIKNIGKLEGSDKLESNNYILFVKVKDNVGNEMTYGSNGVVLENDTQDISVTYVENQGKNVEDKKEKYGDTYVNYYSENVTLRMQAYESGSVYSGLKQMGYQVSYVYGDGTTKKDEEIIEKGSPQNVTLGKLDAYRTITKEWEFESNKDNSQVITVTAPAGKTMDNAGNTMENDAVHTLVIDSTPPTVKSEYTQKNLNENNKPRFRNKKYANSDVTYTVTVTERFLKDITVSINGKDYTLDELETEETQASLGIKEIKKDELPDITKTTDQTEYVFHIVFDKDGKYNVKTIATDVAGNKGCDVGKIDQYDDGFEFIIDTVVPTLDLTYTAKQNNTETQLALDPKYKWFAANNATAGDNGTIGITAVLTEENFSAEFADIAVEATDSTGAAVDITDYKNAVTKAVKTQERWTESNTDEGRKYTLALPEIAVDANYKITYTCTDLAGNPLKPIMHHVTLDRKNPEGEVKAEDLENNGSPAQIWNSLIETITFGYFGKNNVRVSMASQDATSGVESTQYLKSADGLTREELENRTDWTPYVSGLSYAANQHLVVYEKVTDKVGNTEYFSTDGIIVDNTSPVPVVTITPTSPGWGKGVYSAGDYPGFSIRVEDPIVNDAYAGLKKITYRIENGTTGYVESNTLADENTGLSKAAHRKVWTGQVSIDPNMFYSNDVKVSVYAEDWSANSVTSQPQTLKVDNKAPIVSFSFDKSDVHNGKYYKNDKTLTITVDERNFDESYLPRVTSTAGGGYRISGWSHNGEIHTATVTFSGDSDYTVSYDCYDLAGNKSNTENLEEFTVDKTVPVIKVSYNNNSAQNGNYYKAARTATITVTEHNFDPSKITVSTTVSAGGAPSIGGWANSGDTHTANIVFNHDADYTFTVSGLDLAENKAADYAQDKFTVDLKNPEVKITGVKDKSANNGTVAPRISISDTNFIASGVKITLKGVNKGEIKIDSLTSISSSANGMNVIFKDFPEGMDDIYTLTAKATDKAGNETKSSITFSVNRDGSTYELGSGTKALVDKKYTNKPQDLEITEINVDDLTTIEITYSLDGKIVTLKEGEDYTITKSGEEGQWKKYLYRIKASCFEEEGNYVINIYSEDTAHNSTTNKTKAKTIAFTVDKTAPMMVVSNLTDRGRYKENMHEFTLNVKDNIFLAYVEVYLDGELFKRFEEDEIAQLNGELSVDIASSNQYQTIELVSCDKAGNISKEVYDPESNAQVPASYRVLVTQNSFVQFINNTPLLVSVIVIIVAIAGLIVVLVKHKKDKEK